MSPDIDDFKRVINSSFVYPKGACYPMVLHADFQHQITPSLKVTEWGLIMRLEKSFENRADKSPGKGPYLGTDKWAGRREKLRTELFARLFL